MVAEPEVRARLEEVIGQSEAAIGRLDEAQRHLSEAARLQEQIAGRRSVPYVMVLTHVASAYLASGELARADSVIGVGLDIERSLTAQPDTLYASLLGMRGSIANARGDAAAAEQAHREVLDIRLRLLGQEFRPGRQFAEQPGRGARHPGPLGGRRVVAAGVAGHRDDQPPAAEPGGDQHREQPGHRAGSAGEVRRGGVPVRRRPGAARTSAGTRASRLRVHADELRRLRVRSRPLRTGGRPQPAAARAARRHAAGKPPGHRLGSADAGALPGRPGPARRGRTRPRGEPGAAATLPG